MKGKRLLLGPVFLMVLFLSCSHRSETTFSEMGYNNMYVITLKYPEESTGTVEKYLTRNLDTKEDISFIDKDVDEKLTLQDGSKIHLKNEDGNLQIEMNKDENPPASLQKIKGIGEGLKQALHLVK